MEAALYNYKAILLDWLDGDSAKISIDLGFSVSIAQTIRVNGINTPEVRGTERPLGVAALNRAITLIPPGTEIEVHSYKSGGGDKYGRYLCDITLQDGSSYAKSMIDASLAKPWDGQGKKPS